VLGTLWNCERGLGRHGAFHGVCRKAESLVPEWADSCCSVVCYSRRNAPGSFLAPRFYTHVSAQLSGWLLLAFAVGMTTGAGVKSALNASVFSASAGAFLLAAADGYSLSVDALRGKKHRDAAREACIKSQLKNMCNASFDSNRRQRSNEIREILWLNNYPNLRGYRGHGAAGWRDEGPESRL
jgi:hypothetical protein